MQATELPRIERQSRTVADEATAPSADSIDFSVAPIAAPFVEGAGRVAASIDIRDRSVLAEASQAAAVARVRELGLAEVLPEIEDSRDRPILVFHMAEILAHANVPVAWQGLVDVPIRAMPDPAAADRIGVPQVNGSESVRWLCFSPIGQLDADSRVMLLNPRSRTLTGPMAAFQNSTPSDHATASDLLGFPHGKIVTYTPPIGESCDQRPLSTQSLAAFVQANQALLAGLTAGATRRLFEEACAYARLRRSAGRSISQHQAVALRLADLAIHQQALSLYLTASVEGCAAAGLEGGPETISSALVTDLAFRVARDAVQIAAGYGYVEGLPFRRLYEQVRTLSSAMSIFGACVGNPAGHAVR